MRDFLTAIALLLIIEGIWPFLSPKSFRQILAQLAQEKLTSLRFSGLAGMALGLLLLYLIH